MAISFGQSVNPPGVGYPGNWPGSDFNAIFIGNNTAYYNDNYGEFSSGKFGDVNGSTNGWSSPSGYLTVTNGYLYQWGTATVGSTPSNSYIAFPTSYYSTVQVWITFGAAYAYPQSTYGGAPYSACARLGPNTISTSGFYYSCIIIDPQEGLLSSGLAYGAGSSTIYWMAVGY